MTTLIIVFIIVSLLILLFYNRKKTKPSFAKQATENLVIPQKSAEPYLTLFNKEKAYTQLAGVRHQKLTSRLNFQINEQVYLIAEPNNRFDANAIKVITDKGIKIGYISKYHNFEILELMNKGFYFITVISQINLDEPEYPQATLKITKTKDRNLIPFTDEELIELSRKGGEVVEIFKQDSRKAFEISQKGVEFEKNMNIAEAIKCFEEAILLPKTPPNTFKRLIVYYRKNKDYSNEIRVLNKWIESVQESKAFDYIKKDEIKEIKIRIKKAQTLQKNQSNS